jgi:hypothetical protein
MRQTIPGHGSPVCNAMWIGTASGYSALKILICAKQSNTNVGEGSEHYL